MSKLDYLTMVIVAVCLAAVIFIGVKVYNLGNTQHPLEEPPQQELADNRSESPADDDIAREPSPAGKPEEDRAASPSVEWDVDDDEVTPSLEQDIPEKEYDTPSESPAAVSSGTGSGVFLVLAGSFRLRSGAEAEVQRLKKLGYEHAEVTLFNSGTFAAVLVDRFDRVENAQKLVNELQTKHRIEAYVHEKRGGK